jgi:hypothetical protein
MGAAMSRGYVIKEFSRGAWHRLGGPPFATWGEADRFIDRIRRMEWRGDLRIEEIDVGEDREARP